MYLRLSDSMVCKLDEAPPIHARLIVRACSKFINRTARVELLKIKGGTAILHLYDGPLQIDARFTKRTSVLFLDNYRFLSSVGLNLAA